MSTFPSLQGLEERLDLSEPDCWNVGDFEGRTRMAVSRGNTVLKETFASCETDLPKLIATVRWSLLRRPYKDFADDAEINTNAYKKMERDMNANVKPHFSKYTRLLRYWESKRISLGVREQFLDLLTIPELLETSEECVDLHSAIEHVRSECSHLLGAQTLGAFYHRIGFDVGHAEVEKKFRPSFFNSNWQREKKGTVPSCTEVIDCVDTMYDGNDRHGRAMHELRMDQGLTVWRAVKQMQYLGRTVEIPLAEFLVTLEEDLARNWQWNVTDQKGRKSVESVTLTAQALREMYGFGPLAAERLIQSEWVEPEQIQSLVQQCMGEHAAAFMREYKKGWKQEQKRENFSTLCTDAMNERGYSAADVAKLMGIKAPEERGGTSEVTSEESRGYRADSEVRNVIYNNHVSRQISVEALVKILARDDAHADQLRQAYIDHRTRFFRRNGATLEGEGLMMRIQRELANAPMRTLAPHFLPKSQATDPTAVRMKDLELQRLERREGKETPKIPFHEVFEVLEERALFETEAAMVRRDALNRMPEEHMHFETVEAMALSLIAGKKGANKVSDAMRNRASHDSEWLTSQLIQGTGEGVFVPTLSQLNLMAKSTIDKALIDTYPEVVRNWYERYPEQLEHGIPNFGSITQPLPRSLCTLLATKDAAPIRFFSRVTGMVPTQGTKILRDLEEGQDVDWRHIHKILGPFSLRPKDLLYQFIQALHESGGDTTQVLEAFAPKWKEAGLEIHPSTMPGFTLKELKPYRLKK